MSKRAIVVLLLGFAVIAVAVVAMAMTPVVPDIPGGHGAIQPSQSTPAAPPPIDWDRPMVGLTVASNTQAADHLSFTPILPSNIGTPIRIIVDDEDSNRGGQQVAYVFQDPVYGRFVLIEGITTFTQASLDALSDCTKSTGCQGTWAQLPLSNGRRGLLITGGPTTGIMWLQGGVTFDVFGPVDTFAIPAAQAVANSL
jgi:hypothetical protein